MATFTEKDFKRLSKNIKILNEISVRFNDKRI